MWIWIANNFAKFHAKRLNWSENITKKFRGGGYFFSNTLYSELICNTIIDLPTSPTVLLLHYIGKQVNCILVTLATSYILPLHKLKNIQFIHTAGLHLSLNITASIQKWLPFSSTQAWSLLCRSSIVPTVEFYLYPTVGTVLIHSVKPELTV